MSKRGGRGRSGKPPKRRVPVPEGHRAVCKHHGTIHVTGGDCFMYDPKHRHEECSTEEVSPLEHSTHP